MQILKNKTVKITSALKAFIFYTKIIKLEILNESL